MKLRSPWLSASFVVALGSALGACSGSSASNNGFGDGTSPDGTGNHGSGDGGIGALGDGGGQGGNFGGNTHDSGGMSNCNPDPANYDIPGNKCDDDGDGVVDNPPTVCDSGLAANGDAVTFAKALGLCQQATATKWGVVSAFYAKGYGANVGTPSDAQHGILPKFGNVIKPREGASIGVISSGSATENDTDQGPYFKGTKSGMQGGGLFGSGGPPPPGYPKPAVGCPSTNNVRDMIDVKLTIKVPANAKGFSFDFDFFSGEWPEYVCTNYNDAFVAFLTSQAFNNGKPDNISFDSNNNPVSVNNGFFQVCTDKVQTGCAGGPIKTSNCPLGEGELQGTGFWDTTQQWCNSETSSGGGATGWLSTKAPIKPGETIVLEFMVWDTGDAQYDSSALLDNFQWIPGDTTTGTGRPPPK